MLSDEERRVKLEERKKRDVESLRFALPELLGDRTDDEIRELYRQYSYTRSANWLTLTDTRHFEKWFLEMQGMFR